MKIINRTLAGLILFSAVSIISCKTQVNYISTEKIAPLEAPFEMPQLKRPVFSNTVFDITDFGAIADKEINNAHAINKAINTCTSKGGGHVLIPKGEYCTGPLILQSNVNLHFENGAVLTFLPDPMLHTEVVLQRYEGTEIMNIQPFIYARDAENIAITGLGTINGPGEVPWKKNLHIEGNKEGSGMPGGKKIEEAGGKRWIQNARLMENYSNVLPVEKRDVSNSYSVLPSLIHLLGCNNVLLEGFKIGKCGPKWTIHPTYCKNVIIRKIATTFSGHSDDAIDLDSSTDILVEYCDLSSGDDLVVIKSGTNEDGWRVNKPTKNVIVRHINAFTDTSSDDGIENAVFSLGTEISGGVNNVYFHDINVVARLFPFRIKSRPGRGGIVQNLTVENLNYGLQGVPHTPWITMEQLKPAGSVCDPLISITNMYRPLRKSYDSDQRTVYRDITFRNIYATKAKHGIYIEPGIANEFQNIVIEDVTIDECKSPLTIHCDAQITLKDYKVAGQNVTVSDIEDSYLSNKSYRFKRKEINKQ